MRGMHSRQILARQFLFDNRYMPVRLKRSDLRMAAQSLVGFNGPAVPDRDQDTEVTGPIKVTLYAATDGTDTDWTIRIRR